MNYNGMSFSKSQGMMFSGIIRTNTTKVYYELTNENGVVIHSNTLNLWGKTPHYNAFKDFIVPTNFDVGRVKVTFFEDNSKAKEIDSFHVNITN